MTLGLTSFHFFFLHSFLLSGTFLLNFGSWRSMLWTPFGCVPCHYKYATLIHAIIIASFIYKSTGLTPAKYRVCSLKQAHANHLADQRPVEDAHFEQHAVKKQRDRY